MRSLIRRALGAGVIGVGAVTGAVALTIVILLAWYMLDLPRTAVVIACGFLAALVLSSALITWKERQ